MSASIEDSKIDLLDTPEQVKRKLKKAFCEPGNITNNGVLAFCKSVIFPLLKNESKSIQIFGICIILFLLNQDLVLPRSDEHGGPMPFSNYAQLEEGFAKQVLST